MNTLKYFLTPVDGRYEDLKVGSFRLNIFRDMMAGLVVAMVAIPLAMGFAMASGLRPEQGIIGGAVAGLVGALFGGSKYQVYGPTAALIPVVAGVMAKYDHGFLVACSVLAGLVLMVMGLRRIGGLVAKVPQSIVVGFTIGIAGVIASSQLGEVFGVEIKYGTSLVQKLGLLWSSVESYSWAAILITITTFVLTKLILKISPFIPGPLIALGVGTVLATSFVSKPVLLIKDKFGAIPSNSFAFTTPTMPDFSVTTVLDLLWFAAAIVTVAAIESLLCSRMADRLAGNTRRPFDPDKELWGQGLVNIIVPLFNGFPHTGALARTATNIKLGAVSPLSGIFKFVFKLALAAWLASYLELVPMASIAGILMFVAYNMVKPAEIREVVKEGKFATALMALTALLVLFTDFLTGVLVALAVHFAASALMNMGTGRLRSAE